MTSRATLSALLVLVSACKPQPGSVRVRVVFENEPLTRCIKAVARTAGGVSVAATPGAIPRTDDELLVGIGETGELTGEIFVTVTRFATPDCSGAPLGSETKAIQLVTGTATTTLEFRYTAPLEADGGADGGVDGGADGGGTDGGPCNLGACGNTPTACELATPLACASDGGCRFSSRAIGAACGDGGLCSDAGACVANACAVLASSAACDDGLPCTAASLCSGGQCVGSCASPPECKRNRSPRACDPGAPTACLVEPGPDGASCAGAPGGRCIAGECRPWVALVPAPLFLRVGPEQAAQPDAGWVLSSPDGGSCDTVISTDDPAPSVTQGGCGTPPLFAAVDDAGVAVLTMTGLDVGPGARVHFVGARPVQLVVLGSASIRGLVSVAATITGARPAGSSPAGCAGQSGASSKCGGGGGALGANGGSGGEGGGQGGVGLPQFPMTLRGGCSGGSGFKAGSSNAGGYGGGALELIVTGALAVTDGGIISASGGGGAAGAANGEGGGGGGSGGLLVLEAGSITLNGGFVTANGGGGAEGGDDGVMSAPGAPGPLDATVAAPAADSAASMGGTGGTGGDDLSFVGGNGGSSNSNHGGGGGGGSAGVLFLRAASCTRGSGALSGARPMGFTCN